VPPVIVALIAPFALPQVGAVGANAITIEDGALSMITVLFSTQPFASVTCTLYVPANNPVTSSVVLGPLGPVHK
jgi:hypothetical protein